MLSLCDILCVCVCVCVCVYVCVYVCPISTVEPYYQSLQKFFEHRTSGLQSDAMLSILCMAHVKSCALVPVLSYLEICMVTDMGKICNFVRVILL